MLRANINIEGIMLAALANIEQRFMVFHRIYEQCMSLCNVYIYMHANVLMCFDEEIPRKRSSKAKDRHRKNN